MDCFLGGLLADSRLSSMVSTDRLIDMDFSTQLHELQERQEKVTRLLNSVRASLQNCLAILEEFSVPSDEDTSHS